MFFGSFLSAEAAGLGVVFEQDPLFYNTNIAPGDVVARTVTVTNTSPENQSVYMDTKNETSDGLADLLYLRVDDGTPTNYFADYFTQLFSETQVSLGTLLPSETRVYTFTASLSSSADNTYQSKTMGFDLCVGFSGGDTICGVTASEPFTTSGGGGGPVDLRLLNEAVGNVDLVKRTATVSWDTNRDATSYLVCGNVTSGPFDLDPNEPYFGYDFDVEEVVGTTRAHAMNIAVSEVGTYECRPAGRRNTDDAFTVGKALRFTIPSGSVAGESIDLTTFPNSEVATLFPEGSVLGVHAAAYEDTGVDQATTTALESSPDTVVEEETSPIENLVAAIKHDENACTPRWLVLLALMTLVWTFIDDYLRSRGSRRYRRFLIRNTIFACVFAVLVLWLHASVFMSTFWWLFLLLWAGMHVLDHASHTYDTAWDSTYRNIFFFTSSLILLVTSLMFGAPCVWWPFVVIAVGSAVAWFAARTESLVENIK